MTEMEWLTSTDPKVMLDWTQSASVDHTNRAAQCQAYQILNERKMRLFACACVRQSWHLLTDERSRNAVLTAERYADGEVTAAELGLACDEAQNCPHSYYPAGINDAATAAAWAAAREMAAREIVVGVQSLLHFIRNPAMQANLLREIVGNPFRPVAFLRPGDKLTLKTEPIYRLVPSREGDRIAATVLKIVSDQMHVMPHYGSVAAVWPLWHPDFLTPTVLSLAEAAYTERAGRECERCHGSGEIDRVEELGGYEERGPIVIGDPIVDCPVCHGTGTIADGTLDPDRLAVLSDALEETGCDNAEILNHLRGWESTPPGMRCPEHSDRYYPCDEYSGTCYIPRRSPCVRGCAIVDLLLGKE